MFGKRYGLLTLMMVVFCAAIGVWLWRLSPPAFWLSLKGIVGANVLGGIVAYLLTFVLRVPNDGSMDWKDSVETDSHADANESEGLEEPS